MNNQSVTTQLRELRQRTNLSMEALAKKAGYKGASSYQRYEDPTLFQEEFIPRKVIDKIAPALIGNGQPPVTSEELYALAGMVPRESGTRKMAQTEPRRGIPEIEVRAGAGGGGLAAVDYVYDEDGNSYEADGIKAQWILPPEIVDAELRTKEVNIRVIEVFGDSMEPTLHSGDRVFIDIAHRAPSPEGIYAVHDGYGLVVKRVELVPNTEPQRVNLISDNAHHTAREMTLDEANIVGRVIGRFTRC